MYFWVPGIIRHTVPWGLKQMLSFLFYLLSHEPVKKQRFCSAGSCSHLILSPPSNRAPSRPSFVLLLHFSSLVQQAHSKDVLRGPCCHLGGLLSQLLLELGLQTHVRESVHFQGRDQGADCTGTPMTGTLGSGPWVWRLPMTWLPNEIPAYNLATISIIKTSQWKFS